MNTSNAPQCWKNRPRTKKGQIVAWWSTKYSWLLNSEYYSRVGHAHWFCDWTYSASNIVFPRFFQLPAVSSSCCTFYSVRFNSTKQPWMCIKKFCRSYFSTAAKWESAATKMGHSVRSEKCIYSHFAIKYSFSGQRASG